MQLHIIILVSGNRVRKVIVNGNITEERIYLGDYEVYRKTVNSVLDTERETLHISDDTGRIALVDTETTNSNAQTIRYQLSNHLGSATLELDNSAAIISYEEYHPFGSTSYRSGSSSAEVSLKRYRYVGKERDEETGLYYYGARYYAAWLCRFVSVDPLKDKFPYYSSYQYAGNKPVNSIDVDGLEPDPNTDTGGQGNTKLIGLPPASAEYQKGEKAAKKTVENIDINQIYLDGKLPKPGDAPTDFAYLIGEDFYYEARAIDFELRNPGETVPEYYREYGQKYLHEFKYETRETLSPDGKLFVDDALKNLQIAMEDGLKANTNLESNSESHREFAFKTHVNAYEKAGVLELGIMDKVKVTLTPEPQDLFSKDGLNQAGQVAIDQLELYKNNPKFAAKQATEAAVGYYSGAISEEVRKYAEENSGYAIDPLIWKLMIPLR